MVKYLADIWKCRYFWLTLVKMDLRTRYRRSFLGIGWSLLHPIAMTIILCIVFSKLLMEGGDVWTYAPYLLAGLATWNFILNGALQGCHCLFSGEQYIRQYPAPMAIYPLRTALGGTLHFLMALTVVVGMSWMLKGFGNLAVLPVLVPNLLILFVFVWSLAVLTGFANVYFQDTQHLSEVGFQLLFYLTPIIYERKLLVNKNLAWLVDYNPLVSLLDLVRVPVLDAQLPTMATYSTALLTLALLTTCASLVLAHCQKRLVFNL